MGFNVYETNTETVCMRESVGERVVKWVFAIAVTLGSLFLAVASPEHVKKLIRWIYTISEGILH